MALFKNKSDVYGGYGGVSQKNHYVPPPSPPFVPQPATVHITQGQIQKMIDQISTVDFDEARSFVSSNSASIVFRNVLIDKGGHKTSVLFTQGEPSDLLTFTSKTTSSIPINQSEPNIDVTADDINTENVFLTKSVTLTSNKNYFVDCSPVPLILTLPSSPEHGDFININFKKERYSLTIKSDGAPINSTDLFVEISDTKIFGLIYNEAVVSWDFVIDSGITSDLSVMDGGTF